jgi:hypothetical protein
VKAAIRDQWTKALRSGDYEQGEGVLRRGDRFCCLGVLCDLAVKAGIIPQEKLPTDEYRYGPQPYGTCVAYLPDVVVEWAELPSHNPKVGSGITLAALNDEGRPFEEIADAIDESF